MNKNNKWFYEFDTKEKVNKDNGETITNIKKFGILKPNRRLREDGELFYASETSRFARAGVLPKAAWGTILSNGGGSISEKEREIYGNLLLEFRNYSFDLQSILIKPESDRTEQEKVKSEELLEKLEDIRKEIQSFESSQLSIFENTAEAKARNRAILWWVLQLSYSQNEQNEYVPVFSGETFEEKLESYDFYEEDQKEDSFILGVIRRLTYLITLWFLGRIDSLDDFKQFDSNFLLESSTNLEETSSSLSSSQISSSSSVEIKKQKSSSSTSSEVVIDQNSSSFSSSSTSPEQVVQT